MPETGIYRLTHYQNLPFILQHGLHCPASPTHDPNFIQIGYPTLISSRASIKVPIPPDGNLNDYIPFYFTIKSPMLYVIAKGNDPEVIITPQEDVIYLVSSIETLVKLKLQFVFTDRHAALDLSNFYSHPNDLKNLNWTIIKSIEWGRQYGSEKKEIKQAECLVNNYMPVEAIIGIGCQTERIVSIVEGYLGTAGITIPVKLKSNWYF